MILREKITPLGGLRILGIEDLALMIRASMFNNTALAKATSGYKGLFTKLQKNNSDLLTSLGYVLGGLGAGFLGIGICLRVCVRLCLEVLIDVLGRF